MGFAWAHELLSRPVVRMASQHTAREIYRQAQRIDEWPGESYEGTSVLAGAKIMQQEGRLEEYRWATSPVDAMRVVSRHGPAVLGIDWYTGMLEPDASGRIHPTGSIVGGHAILMIGVNLRKQTVTLLNSWGQGWGLRGQCVLGWPEFAFLLRNNGECCVAVRRA